MAPPRKPWTRYESLNPQVVPAPNLKHVARGGKGNGRAKANGRGKGRGAKKKWWEDCEGMCTVCAPPPAANATAAPLSFGGERYLVVHARGRREPLSPLQGLAQGLNPNRGG